MEKDQGSAGRRHCRAKATAGIRRKHAEYLFGSILLGAELLYNGLLIFTGHMNVYTLPLHLCAVSVLLCVIGAFSGSARIGQYMYYFGLPGALCALLFPDWTRYPILNMYSLLEFFIHSLLVSGTAALLAAGRIRPTLRGLAGSCVFVAILAAFLWFFNFHFHTNYMFIMEPVSDSPLAWISKLTGENWYLAGFILLVLIVEFLLYLPWFLVKNKTNREV